MTHSRSSAAPSSLPPGQPYPLGATVVRDGVNFSVFSKHCTALELLLFDDVTDEAPSRVIRLDAEQHKTYYYWHVRVPGIKAGQLYAYRAHGPFAPHEGHWFDGDKVLIDPYARCVDVGPNYDRKAAIGPGDNVAHCMKSVVVDPAAYDWEDDLPLCRPLNHTLIYELHVGGFTRHPNSNVAPNKRGTYAGLVEKIPYLKELGVTAVELMPVQQFDTQDVPRPLTNYWGYNPVAFFAPHCGYSSDVSPMGPVNEFRDMVKALHRAGIEVILDVVFNHTAEGDHRGPILCYRGFENRAYYILEADRTRFANYTGTGNTLNANHSIVRRLVRDCLRYWVQEMHVDGFRFDLASVLARDERGVPLENPPLVWEIESDPVLAGTKIIAEAWDAGGLYQVGSFVGHRWVEWNGRFRDDVRRFVKGDPGMAVDMAARLVGSPDIYPPVERLPHRSVNFITCHDGFTMADLVSYNEKHNEANGEGNRDGMDANYSWNCGVEGLTDDPEVEALRLQQVKNFMTILMVAQGTPMLLMGDEVLRTQHGNNNAYCQDNALSWFDWQEVASQADLLRFVRGLIDFNLNELLFRQDRFWVATHDGDLSQITWHGVRLGQPDLGFDSHSLAFTLHRPDGEPGLHVIINAYWDRLLFELPPLDGDLAWHRIVDTALKPPRDYTPPAGAAPFRRPRYSAQARSVVVLTTAPGA